MSPMYGASLALAGYWANQQRDIELGRAANPWHQDGHILDVAQCEFCKRDIRQRMRIWLSMQRAIAERELSRKLKGKALKRFLDDRIKDCVRQCADNRILGFETPRYWKP